MDARLPDGTKVRAIAVGIRPSHPAIRNANDVHAESLSATERFCKRIAESTGAPITLVAVIILQVIWIVAGQVTKMDPFPYIFMLTVSNVIQLVLIVVLAVAGRQQSKHDSIRAEEDHVALSLILQRLDALNRDTVILDKIEAVIARYGHVSTLERCANMIGSLVGSRKPDDFEGGCTKGKISDA